MNTADQKQTEQKTSLLDLEKLYKQYKNIPALIARNYRFTVQEQEDISQDVWLKCINHISSLRDPKSFKYWLNKISHTTCIQVYHRNAKLGTQVSLDIDDDPINLGQDNQLSPEHVMAATQRNQMIRKLSDFLEDSKSSEHKVLYRYYFEDRTVKEISDGLNMNKNTVLSHLRRGRKRLMDRIDCFAD